MLRGYRYLFYRLYLLSPSSPRYYAPEDMAWFLLSAAEMIGLVFGVLALERFTGVRVLSFSSLPAAASLLGIAALNYSLLLREEKLKAILREFEAPGPAA